MDNCRGEQQSTKIKTCLIAISLIGVTLFSGVIFGWATIRLIFEDDGVFSKGCHASSDDICEEQQRKFSLVYNVASTVMAFASFFSGLFVDKMGPVWASVASGACVGAGLLMFGTAGDEELGEFIFSSTLTAIGGSLILLNSFTLGYVLDQKHMPLVLSAVNCLFDASGVTFLAVYLIYTHLKVSRKDIFLGMSIIAMVLLVTQAVLWWLIEPELIKKKEAVFRETENSGKDNPLVPESGRKLSDSDEGQEETETEEGATEMTAISSIPQEDPDANTTPLGDSSPKDSTSRRSLTKKMSSRTVLEKHSTYWLKELQSRAFIFIVIFGSMQFFRVNTMFGIILDILKYLGDEDTGYLYTQIFVAVMPLGFLCVPVIDYNLKRFGLVNTFYTIIFWGCAYGACVMIPVLEVQVLTFIFFTIFRAYLFSVMAYYSVHRFGPINSGRIYGLAISMAGTLNFINYPMMLVVVKYWDGDFFYYNLIQFLFCIPLVASVHYLLKPIVKKLDDLCIRSANKLTRSG